MAQSRSGEMLLAKRGSCLSRGGEKGTLNRDMSRETKVKREAARPVTPCQRMRAQVKRGKAAMEEATAKIHPKLSAWQERQLGMRLHQRQAVFELHCRQGYSLEEVGVMLGVSTKMASHHWAELKRALAEQAPSTPEQMTAVREEIAARLWAAVEETHGRLEVVGTDGEVTTVNEAATPQMLAVRLRALEQLAKLYGVCGEGPGIGAGGEARAQPKPFVTPLTVMVEVRRRQVELFRRCGAGEG